MLALAASLASATAHAQDNAAPLWRAAFTAAGYGTQAPVVGADDQAFLADLHPPLGQEQRARLDDILQRTTAIRQQFEAAARIKRCDWELDRSKGFELLLPHLGQMRQAAGLLRAQAMAELEDGNSADAVATILLLGNVGVQSGQDRILVSSLVGNAVGAMGMTELAQSAIDAGAIDEKSAQSMLDALGPLKGDDPFRFADAVQGEGQLMAAQLNGCKSDADLQQMLAMAGAKPGTMTLEQAKGELGGMRPLYDRAARAFANPDPSAAIAELQRIEQQVDGGRAGALAKMLMPALLSTYQRKLQGAQELALLVAKLQKIAEGKEKPAELRNAALLLARASAGARSVPDDVQESIELLRVAPAALDAERTARAAETLLRADRSVFAPLAAAVECRRCDFARIDRSQPTLEVTLLGGLRGAVRMALAKGLRDARAAGTPDPAAPAVATAYRVAALLAMDPSMPRAIVAGSIWHEASAALSEAAKLGPLGKDAADGVEQAMIAMPSGDPFAFRQSVERDAERIVEDDLRTHGQFSAATKEARAARAQILRQRGPSQMLVAILARSLPETLPSAKDPALVRIADLYPAERLDPAVSAIREQQRKATERNEDAPVRWDLPLDEQKSRMRKADPFRTVQFLDAGTITAAAAADYAASFDVLKAARDTQRRPSPSADEAHAPEVKPALPKPER